MNPAAREWVEKAEEDWRVAARESRVRRGASHGAVAFHSQQCAEKYLKAVLLRFGVSFPKTHDLLTLRSLALPSCPAISRLSRRTLALLSEAAVEYRYPGKRITPRQAASALSAAKRIRGLLRKALGI